MSSKEHDDPRLEWAIHSSFLLDRWLLENQFGHCAVQRHYDRFWKYSIDQAEKSNFIDVKLRKIEAGSAPVHAIAELSLPKSVKDIGSKKALILMMQLPGGILDPYHTWAQNLCFIDHLLDLKPDYGLLLDLKSEYYGRFKSLYKSELRQLNKQFSFSKTANDKIAFYEKLFQYPYPVKCDIFRCLCEGKLNSSRC
jgi:hypothetical protein